MRLSHTAIAAALLVAGASLAQAQAGAGMPAKPMMKHEMQGMEHGPGMMHEGPAGGLAGMLLAHTGELKLSDQQVTRLAAIARRATDRHNAMRAMMDSVMRANRDRAGVGPSTAMMEHHQTMMTRMRDQERADVRDALAVLTVDQQADAWMMRGGAH